jgi:hypothetical protein
MPYGTPYEAIDANDLSAFGDEDIQTMRANAEATKLSALGHNKSAMNERHVKIFDDELKSRGITPDPDLEGIFNGPGAT